jgi:hypothetical protein
MNPMTLEEFRQSVKNDSRPPAGSSELLSALWWDARGDWTEAHRIAQNIGSGEGSRIHAYLHRKEGDPDNARYWYRRAGRAECTESLEAEWESLATEFLGDR